MRHILTSLLPWLGLAALMLATWLLAMWAS